MASTSPTLMTVLFLCFLAHVHLFSYTLFMRLHFFRACIDRVQLGRADIETKKAGTRVRSGNRDLRSRQGAPVELRKALNRHPGPCCRCLAKSRQTRWDSRVTESVTLELFLYSGFISSETLTSRCYRLSGVHSSPSEFGIAGKRLMNRSRERSTPPVISITFQAKSEASALDKASETLCSGVPDAVDKPWPEGFLAIPFLLVGVCLGKLILASFSSFAGNFGPR